VKGVLLFLGWEVANQSRAQYCQAIKNEPPQEYTNKKGEKREREMRSTERCGAGGP